MPDRTTKPPGISWPGRARLIEAGLAGLGAFAVILVLAGIDRSLGLLLLIAPFGASCALVMALPASPLAQPRNVVGGHLVATGVGLLVLLVLGSSAVAIALAVGLATAGMVLTGTLHPPAGADPIVVMLSAAPVSFLLLPVLAGSLLITIGAWAYHRWVTRKPYPHRPPA